MTQLEKMYLKLECIKVAIDKRSLIDPIGNMSLTQISDDIYKLATTI